MKEETLKRVVVSIVFVTLVCIVFSVFFSLAPSGWTYPNEVLNTLTACDWCESNCSDYYEHCPPCVGGGTCDACVDYYRNHFNLTQEAFPCYCWDSSESAPNKIEWFFMKRY